MKRSPSLSSSSVERAFFSSALKLSAALSVLLVSSCKEGGGRVDASNEAIGFVDNSSGSKGDDLTVYVPVPYQLPRGPFWDTENTLETDPLLSRPNPFPFEDFGEDKELDILKDPYDVSFLFKAPENLLYSTQPQTLFTSYDDGDDSAYLDRLHHYNRGDFKTRLTPQMYPLLLSFYRDTLGITHLDFSQFKTLGELAFWTAQKLQDPYFGLYYEEVGSRSIEPLNLDTIQVFPKPSQLQVQKVSESIEAVIFQDYILCACPGFFELKLCGKQNVVVFSIESFPHTTPESLKKLRSVAADYTDYPWIIDVQGNGGGFVDTCSEICDVFLGDGIVFTTPVRKRSYSSEGTPDDLSLKHSPLVLMDGYSASASEILVRVLREKLNSSVVGETSFGKNAMQDVSILLVDNSPGVIKTAYTIDKTFDFPEGVGVVPDFNIPDSLDENYYQLSIKDQQEVVRSAVISVFSEGKTFTADRYEYFLAQEIKNKSEK